MQPAERSIFLSAPTIVGESSMIRMRRPLCVLMRLRLRALDRRRESLSLPVDLLRLVRRCRRFFLLVLSEDRADLTENAHESYLSIEQACSLWRCGKSVREALSINE